jgi:LDH2 family malate/lactate/ureidoglycolate dehydrogenase
VLKWRLENPDLPSPFPKETDMITLSPEKLITFISQIFYAAGASEADANQVATSLVGSNLAGHDSHGVIRVPQYLTSIAQDNIRPAAQPIIAHELGAITKVDAQHSFGQIAARFAIQCSIAKAQQHGLAATTLINSNHIGRVGEWVLLAAEQNLIGLAFCNGGTPGGLVAPYGGAGRLLGTNPVAIAVPVADRPPLLLDYATSIVAEGKVRVARNAEKMLPEGWILDGNGRSSTNPHDLYDGGMLLPAATYKGYCLSLMVELLGGILTGQGTPIFPGYVFKNGVLFIVLNIEAFRPLDDFLHDAAVLCAKTKAIKPAEGFAEVLLPGELEWKTAEFRRQHGIPLDETTWSQLAEAAQTYDLPVPEFS